MTQLARNRHLAVNFSATLTVTFRLTVEEAKMFDLATITFFEVMMALLFIGLAERLLLGYAPASMVGSKGWLLRGDIEE